MRSLGQQVLLLFPILVNSQQSPPDNQRCYFGAGELASTDFVPCYTSWTAEATFCCKRGNVCLENSACYDPASGNTYQSGCTDSTYKHANCPKKCGLDTKKSSWVGLVYCDGTNGTPKNTWICNHPDNCSNCPKAPWDPSIMKLPPGAKCSEKNTNLKAMDAPGSLSNIMNIPADPTSLSSYFAAHPTSRSSAPTSVSATVTSITTPTTGSTGEPTPNSTKSQGGINSPDPSPESSSNTNAMAIGLGIAIPTILTLIGVGVFLFLRRRRQERTEVADHKTTVSPSKGSPLSPNDSELGYSFKTEFKAELPADSAVKGHPRKNPSPDTPAQPKPIYELA